MSEDGLLDETNAVAIIGMACRFPGAKTVDKFWDNLLHGRESIARFSIDELRAAGVPEELAKHPDYVPAGGVLDDVYAFDAALFGYAEGEAELIDPQQRLFLQCAWEALEDAGHAPRGVSVPTGVFAGCSASTHLPPALIDPREGATARSLRLLTANDKDYLATRVSYKLDLKGPSLTVQTACSTSLVAVHLAAQSILSGECAMALAGGATITLPQEVGYLYQEGLILSPDGRCRAYDERAAGVVGGNGVGVVLLKRLAEAIADGDPIWAVLRGSAVNNDGADKIGYTAPSAEGQARVIAEALAVADVSAASVGYLEGHGTGTPLGDPIEVQALTRVFRAETDAQSFCALGSVKSNIGHLDAAAGIASLIKAALVAYHGQIPPSLHVDRPNAKMEIERSPFYLPRERRTWPAGAAPRRVGVSSFGFGGTNAHAVLEEPPRRGRREPPSRIRPVVTLSAMSDERLLALAGAYGDLLRDDGGPTHDIADVAYTTNVGRHHFTRRLAIVADSRDELRRALGSMAEGAGQLPGAPSVSLDARRERQTAPASLFQSSGAHAHSGIKPVFLFTGQGAQYAGMARGLYEAHPPFRAAFDRCAAVLRDRFDLVRMVTSLDGGERLKETRYAQPCLFSVAFALSELWKAWGVAPAAVLGHSVGELAAAAVAGVLSLEDALRLTAARGELMHGAPGPGEMVAVFAPRGLVEDQLAGGPGPVAIAAINGDERVVISGARDAVRKHVEAFERRGVTTRPLHVAHAFHSPLMEPARDPLRRAAEVPHHPASTALFLNVGGRVLRPGDRLDPAYWPEQLLCPVEFARCLGLAAREGHRVFLELGPQAVLTKLGAEVLSGGDAVFIASLSGGQDDRDAISEALARLYAAGVDIDWAAVHDGQGRRVRLPATPFERVELRGPAADVPERAVQGGGNDVFPDLMRAGSEQAEAGLVALDLAIHVEEERSLEDLCSSYFRLAFGQLGLFRGGELSEATRSPEGDLGWSTPEEACAAAGVAPRFVRVVRSVAETLAARGELRRGDGGRYGELASISPEACARAERAAAAFHARTSALGEIVLAMGRALPEVLKGARDPRAAIFSDGSVDAAYRVYAELPTSRYFNGIVREVVRALVESELRPARVLEIGGGTGATTEQILPLLDGDTTYVFTDVSPVFLERARERFSSYPKLDLRLLDIGRGLIEQSFAPHSVDLIVAANSVHAAPDLRRALQNARSLLAPSGVLVLYEVTRNSLTADLTTGLLLGDVTDGELRRGRMFLEEDAWERLLAECGFVQRKALPDARSAGALIGERVLVAQAGGKRRAFVGATAARRDRAPGEAVRTDLFYGIDWRPAAELAAAPRSTDALRGTAWIVCADRGGFARTFVEALARAGARASVVLTPDTPGGEAAFAGATCHVVDLDQPEGLARAVRAIDQDRALARRSIACFWGLDAERADTVAAISAAQRRHLKGMLHLVGALDGTSWEDVERFLVFTRGAQAIGDEAPAVAEAPLLGFVRSIAVGHPELHLRLVDVDPATAPKDLAPLLDVLTRVGPNEEVVALRGERVLAPRIARMSRRDFGAIDAEIPVSPDRTYLVVGGRGGIGMKVAERLADKGARHLVLLGRSEPGERALSLAEALVGRGVKVELARGDVTDLTAMRALVDRIQRSGAALGGVVHSALDLGAGMSSGRPLWDEFATVLAPKVEGAWVLHEVTRDLSLDFFVLFSSSVSLVPAYGLPHYGAANAFLDALAAFRRARGLPALSISWGLWLHVGAVADPVHAAQVERGGLLGLAPEYALACLDRAFATRRAHLGILDARWPELLRGYPRSAVPAIYDEVERPAAPAEPVEDDAAGRRLKALPEGARAAGTAAHVRRRLARMLRIDEGRIEPAANLMELGLDSLMFLNLTASLSKELGVRIAPTKVLRAANGVPTAGALTEHITAALTGEGPAEGDDPRAFFRDDEAGRYEPFPLNEVQQAYWIGRGAEMILGDVSCHGYFELDCEALDVARLERALQRLIDRHDMLRVVLLPDGRQQVLETVPAYRIELLDLSGTPAPERAARLAELRASLSHRAAPCERWPLFDIRATRVDERTTRVHVGIDMIALDGRSMAIVLREWAELYEVRGRELPPLGIRFRDYVAAQRAFERSAAYARSWRYWEARLRDMPLGPALPLAKDPARIQKPRFERRGHRLPREAWSRLKSRAASFGLTPSGVLLAAYAEVLGAFTRRQRFTLSLPTFNRLPVHPEVQEVVGEFTTLTPLVVDRRRGATFVERAVAVQRQLLDDLEHRHVGGVRVLRELRRMHEDRPELITPVVFTSLFGLDRQADTQHADDAAQTARLGEMVFSISQTPQVLLDHHVHEGEGHLGVYWDAVEEAFAPGALEAMFAAYTGLLEELSGEGEAAWRAPSPVGLPAVQAEARRHASSTRAPESGDLLHSAFRRRAQAEPSREAVVCGERRLTYGELAGRAAWLADRILARGVAPGELVAVVMERGWEQVVAVLAVLEAGGAYVPIDATLPEKRIHALLETTGAKLVLTQTAVKGRIIPRGVEVETVDNAGYRAPSWGEPRQGPHELAYVIYTSGSTGVPKGVMIEHRSAVNTVEDINDRLGVGPEDRVFGVSSLSFDLSVYDVFGTLAAGGCLVMPEQGSEKDPERWLSLLERERVTLWNSVPALLQMLVDYAEGRGATLGLRLALLSGDWIPLDLPERLRKRSPGTRCISLGGATEASIWSIVHPIEGALPGWTSVPYGRPLRNQRWYVLNDRMEECPDHVTGELYIGGLGLARGYWGDATKTAERFISWADGRASGAALEKAELRARAPTGERLYKTGDLGRWRDGLIELLGRDDQQVKIGGHRVELGEIEAAFAAHASVKAAAVVAHGDPRDSRKQLIGYVVLRDGAQANDAELLQHLRERLPEHMVPRHVRAVDALPLSANGKVDRSALPRIDAAEQGGEYVAPRTDLERHVAALWQEILGAPRVSMRSSFFELGGDSLAATRFVLELERRRGLKLSMRALFTEPVLERLVARIQAASSESPATGKELGRAAPSAMPLQPPTVAELARALEEPRGSRRGFQAVRLNRAVDTAQVFCIEAPGDGVWRHEALARALDGRATVIAVERGADEGEELSVEALADDCAAVVRPLGRDRVPCVLVGWSFGGAMALEVARRLRDAGAPLVSLILLDSAAPAEVRDGVERWLGVPLEQVPAGALVQAWSASRHEATPAHRGILRPGDDAATWRSVSLRLSAKLRALGRYEPRAYAGDALLIAAQASRGPSLDLLPDRGWTRILVGRFEIEPLECGHYDFALAPVASRVAAIVARVLERTANADPRPTSEEAAR
ncbi:amino acid adenylation domain-containing protein [Sorangium cellulosum]|uniref:non-ribosomal peptide synthetase/type I polyketide synthase n=1 Tax=Sorangium cellulosum TaxID=56 RepID=UPI003D9A64F6